MYQYTFHSTLPAGYDPTLTYTVGMQVDRTVNGQRTGPIPVFDFVPAGGTPQIRQDVTTDAVQLLPRAADRARQPARGAAVHAVPHRSRRRSEGHEHRLPQHDPQDSRRQGSAVDRRTGRRVAQIYSSFRRYRLRAEGRQRHRHRRRLPAQPRGAARLPQRRRRPRTTTHDARSGGVRDLPRRRQPVAADDRRRPAGDQPLPGRASPTASARFCHAADSGKEFDISVPGAHVVPERSTQLAGSERRDHRPHQPRRRPDADDHASR